MFPDVPIRDADSGHDVFNRAASRNEAMRTLNGYEAVLLCDADTLVEADPVMEAVHQAHSGALHLPFTLYRSWSRNATRRLLDGEEVDESKDADVLSGSTGGAMVMSPAAWWGIGGMDERFTAWGYEDVAFPLAATVLGSGVVRHAGSVWHLWHPTDRNAESPQQQAGAQLCHRYIQAEAPEAMRDLVDEHVRERAPHP
ncbi:galactosyltransferase-related protein [Streptomyces lavendulae]|uniref:glycosyltransferase family 2 protein n=1 Tax=Streptomyces lavendulae TaxID=1914 RepID=UPI0033F18023